MNKEISFFLLTFLVIFSFAIDVSAGTTILTWDSPTTNEDGTPLTDLAGYKIYRGSNPGSYVEIVDSGINGCSTPAPQVSHTCTFLLIDIQAGQVHYFAVTAYDYSGNESRFSNEVTKIVGIDLLDFIDLISNKGGTYEVANLFNVAVVSFRTAGNMSGG